MANEPISKARTNQYEDERADVRYSSSHPLVVHFASTHLQNHHGQEQHHDQQEPRQSRAVSHFVPVEGLVVQVEHVEAGVVTRVPRQS